MDKSPASVQQRPANRAADSHEIRCLTGLRGAAAVWVLLFHFYSSWIVLLPAIRYAHSILSQGCLGVNIFFVLSGFILSYVYLPKKSAFGLRDYGNFISHRIARIYPTYLVALGMLIVLVVGSSILHLHLTGVYPYSHLIFHLTLTQVWPFTPGSWGGEWVNTAWTLSAEWFAYLFVFPAIAFIHRRDWGPVSSLTVGCGFLAIFCFWYGFVLRHLPINGALLGAVCQFAAGGLAFSAYARGAKTTEFCRRFVTVFALVALLLLLFPGVPSSIIAPCLIFLIPFGLIGLTSEASVIGFLLSTPFALWLGRVSYALYITHTISQKILKFVLPFERYEHASLLGRVSVMLLDTGMVFLIAVPIHYFVEIPARNFLRRARPIEGLGLAVERIFSGVWLHPG